ncbi:uncharacterized protein RCC_05752 [Ramularia collo-cygni]|uniref:Mso1 N-terminal domain-containing protein n=1 Tax=Ramularia collo-cygni TaxID=112498 RepID=A0A2D3V8F2_9PEZI|nr:uncharacterized protein RCC_05752 [Ramularia collo-cygni]CZT19896.1 uncharacterized protein RCC_05752 [Ramularia collo-cygni]
MSSYISNLLTHTTSRYNSLRRTLLSSEDDGDTEDDTHICRVLRAYYTEKGRSYPQWLPPDPNDRKSLPPTSSQQSGYFTSAGGRSQYGSAQNQSQPGQRASLSDLWDPPSAPQNNTPVQPQSLRASRRPMNAAAPAGTSSLAPPQARPLPSQRAGSYQSVSSQQSSSRPSSGMNADGGPASAGTAQDRLKARLWGGGRSPAPSQVGAPNAYETGGNAGAGWGNGGGQQQQYDGGGGSSNRRYGRQ